MLTVEEANKLKKVIDSMTSIEEYVDAAQELNEIGEGEVIAPEIEPMPKELTELELKKMFRHQVPENFDPKNVEMVRSPMTGDRVFLKYGNERRWMPDPETMERLGFTMADVKEIDDNEMKDLKEGFGLLSAKLW